MRNLLHALLLLALVAGATASHAQGPGPGGPGDIPALSAAVIPAPSVLSIMRPIGAMGMDMFSARLKLTDEQKPKVRELLTKADEAIKPKVTAQRKAAEAFVEAVTKCADESTLLSLGEATMKADAELLADRIKTYGALCALLTAEQKTELENAMGRFATPWTRKRGPMGPPPSLPPPPAPAPEQ